MTDQTSPATQSPAQPTDPTPNSSDQAVASTDTLSQLDELLAKAKEKRSKGKPIKTGNSTTVETRKSAESPSEQPTSAPDAAAQQAEKQAAEQAAAVAAAQAEEVRQQQITAQQAKMAELQQTDQFKARQAQNHQKDLEKAKTTADHQGHKIVQMEDTKL